MRVQCPCGCGHQFEARDHRVVPVVERTCPGCSSVFESKLTSRQTHCSRECQVDEYKRKRRGGRDLEPPATHCERCDAEIEEPRPGKRYCSRDCQLKARRKQRRADVVAAQQRHGLGVTLDP